MDFDWLESEDDYLIYFGDTMCSWCHGFAPELSKLAQNNPDLPLKVVNGGLRPYNKEKAIDMADFLRSHWVEIGERTGQAFSFDILKDASFIYDTEPASRAVVVVRRMKPEIEFEFFKAVQLAFYKDNRNTNELQTYLDLAEQFELDKEAFQQLFESEEIKQKVKEDFQLSAEMGIRGFPSLVLKKEKNFYLLSNGYQKAENLQATINSTK